MKLKKTLMTAMLLAATTATAQTTPTNVIFNINGEITAATCSLATGEADQKGVFLTTISLDHIAGAGKESTVTGTIDTKLNCPPSAVLKLTMTDNNVSGSTNDYLVSLKSRAGTGTSQNSAMRVYYKDQTTPITMGKQFATERSTSQGIITLPFTAKYYNPTGNATPGTVRTQATLSIAYE